MQPLPNDVVPYKRTKEFTEDSVPKGLLSRHSTKAGTWGRICVLEGELIYRILEPEAEGIVEEVRLSPGKDGHIEPEVAHEVEPVGQVRFWVEFLKRGSPVE